MIYFEGNYALGKENYSLISLWDMLRFYANDFINIADSLRSIAGIAGLGHDESVSSDERLPLKNSLEKIRIACDAITLNVSAVLVRRILRHFDQDPRYTYHELSRDVTELKSRIEDELSERFFLFILPEKVNYLENKQPFGSDVVEQCPNVALDIEEASKCLGLQRPTACVFHLMRVLEDGLKSLARLLGIPYAPSWESYIRQISDRIQQKHKKKGIRWKKDESFFKDILGDLEAVKIAWRNPTMHIVRVYMPEEAEQIFGAVRIFMQHIAKRLSVDRISKTNGTS